ncbi:hypothetical protein [Paenibacillus caui]|uniref:hypothetical protein n=1 Tax=Paenibacillus caui TaxID=2873927 RepID=UPI001CA9101C|nr:hypothetical protein [Paenibacillus caui]
MPGKVPSSLRRRSPCVPICLSPVLTAGRQSDEWLAGQKRLLNLSRNTKHLIIEDSWHAIQIHRPRAVNAANRE